MLSAAYALSALDALHRWLIEQRYVLANRFAGARVRGGRLSQLEQTARVTSGA